MFIVVGVVMNNARVVHASIWDTALMSVEALSIQALVKTVRLLSEQRVSTEFVAMDHMISGFTEDSLNSHHC